LAGNLRAVISQSLIPKKSGFGRVAAFEIMISTPAIQNLIRENKSYRITSAIQTGHKYGMNLLDEHLMMLWKKGIIGYDEAVSKAQNASDFEVMARELALEDGPKPLAPGEKAPQQQQAHN
jgi:twitching motility protein PilT